MIRGYKAGRFSFNVKVVVVKLREGSGVRTIEMNFLLMCIECETCQGKRLIETLNTF
jgi:excinuclease ABC subunit A